MSQEKLMKWLESGSDEMCMITRHSSESGYFRHKLSNGIDIIYVYGNIRGGVIPLYKDPEYQGLYKRETGQFYDMQYTTRELFGDGRYQELEYSALQEEFESRVRERVEEMVAEFEDDIKLDDTTKSQQKSQEYYAGERARKIYLQDIDTDFTYQCEYGNCNFKNKLMQYVLNSETVVNETAKTYLADNEDKIRENIVQNLMTRQRVGELKAGKDKLLTAMRNIIQSIPVQCKTVNVTTVIDGKELTFKYEASKLRRDCNDSYSAWWIPAQDRREFEMMYGRNKDFTPMDITKITYGKKVLYEKEAETNEEKD